ncbi:MAG: type II restriction endonuclease [Candidatus Eutrophobiaceae bacterium]
MAKIEAAQLKKAGSEGYLRLFGIPKLDSLISRVHSAVISNGTELEKIILEMTQSIPHLDDFLNKESKPDGVFVASKKDIKNSAVLGGSRGIVTDFLVFECRGQKQTCHAIELKDGHQFDTKKARAEHKGFSDFVSCITHKIRCRVHLHFCCFNQNSRAAIVTGFKQKITIEEAMTGKEFCELLEIDYETIVKQRKADQPKNVEFFVRELLKISEVRQLLEQIITQKRE